MPCLCVYKMTAGGEEMKKYKNEKKIDADLRLLLEANQRDATTMISFSKLVKTGTNGDL